MVASKLRTECARERIPRSCRSFGAEDAVSALRMQSRCCQRRPAAVNAVPERGTTCIRAKHGETLPDTILTPREEEVLKPVAEGYSTREIAKTLAISAKTVERRRANILQKLGLRDRLALTRYAIRAGLIEP